MMTLASAAWSSSRADVFVRRASAPRAAASLSPPLAASLAAVPRPRAGLLALRPSFATSATPLSSRADAFALAARHRAASRAPPPPSARGAVVAASSFADLGLDPDVLAATDALGLVEPTDIQVAAIPRIAAGGHHLVASHTGSGKTLTYLLPIVHQLRREEAATGARANPNVLASSSSVPPANSRNRCAGWPRRCRITPGSARSSSSAGISSRRNDRR